MHTVTKRQFEVNRYRANAYCPCGRSNRKGRFATEKGFSGQPIGYCFTCGKNFWSDNNTIVKPYQQQVEVLPICFCETKELKDSFDTNLESSFSQFLLKTFGEDKAIDIVEKYFLGNLNGDVVFWQLDRDKTIRSGKVMAYGEDGKRKQKFSWIRQKNCELKQCYFGEHLIDESDLPIAIVESEKTACIMSICNPSYIWLACGSASNLQSWKCRTIEKFDVTLFPDQNQYDNWKVIAEEHKFQISKDCEIWYEKGFIEAKDDIADYYLAQLNTVNPLHLTVEKTDSEWNQEEYDAIFNRPEDYRSDIYTGRMPDKKP